jgi:hypothetical protein
MNAVQCVPCADNEHADDGQQTVCPCCGQVLWDWEAEGYALDDCIYWSRPEANCGVTVVCENHFNDPPN